MTSSKTTIGENEPYVMEVSIIDETDGTLVTGATVTYDVQNSITDVSVTSGSLAEVAATGLYKATHTFTAEGNYRVVYSTAGYADTTESVFVGDVNTDIDKLVKIGCNRWKLDSAANTFTVYEDDGTTPLIVFDMSDSGGSPSVNRIFERDPQ